MKRLFALIIAMVLVCAVAVAEIDLFGMSFAELVELKDKINLAIWNCEEWQEVEVPHGVWVVGEDIPAGTWTVKCTHGRVCSLAWGEKLKDGEPDIDFVGRHDYAFINNPNHGKYDDGDLAEYTFTVEDGDYIVIDKSFSTATFTPYIGKPSLGFK